MVLGSTEWSSSHVSVRHAHNRKILYIVLPYSRRVVRWHRLGGWCRNPSRPLLLELSSVHDRDQVAAATSGAKRLVMSLPTHAVDNTAAKGTVAEGKRPQQRGAQKMKSSPGLVTLHSQKTGSRPGQQCRADSIACAVTNARNLPNKIAESGVLLQVANIDILGVTESWCHEGCLAMSFP